jgi:lipopolysaccharide transport system permease protein
MNQIDNYEVKIGPIKSKVFLNIKELWHYRELFYIFAWRDIKVRYKQTILGVAWALLQPVTSMFIFTVFFGKIARISSDGLPYSLFVLTGLIFWGFFSNALTNAASSLIENEGIIKKIYFPRLILPLSAIMTNLVDFGISFVLLLIVTFYFGYVPSLLALIIIPLGMIITSLGAAGLGLFLSAFNVKYRDVRYILPFFIQLLIFLTPVIYPLSIVGHINRLLVAINPMAGVIESARKVITGSIFIDYQVLVISLVSSILIFIAGLYYFRSTEKFFADII